MIGNPAVRRNPVERSAGRRLAGPMTHPEIRVDRATDVERYLATDHVVWFSEVSAASTEHQLIGVPEDQRFAADTDGADPAAYPGIYGVFPLTLSIPGPD